MKTARPWWSLGVPVAAPALAGAVGLAVGAGWRGLLRGGPDPLVLGAVAALAASGGLRAGWPRPKVQPFTRRRWWLRLRAAARVAAVLAVAGLVGAAATRALPSTLLMAGVAWFVWRQARRLQRCLWRLARMPPGRAAAAQADRAGGMLTGAALVVALGLAAGSPLVGAWAAPICALAGAALLLLRGACTGARLGARLRWQRQDLAVPTPDPLAWWAWSGGMALAVVTAAALLPPPPALVAALIRRLTLAALRGPAPAAAAGAAAPVASPQPAATVFALLPWVTLGALLAALVGLWVGAWRWLRLVSTAGAVGPWAMHRSLPRGWLLAALGLLWGALPRARGRLPWGPALLTTLVLLWRRLRGPRVAAGRRQPARPSPVPVAQAAGGGGRDASLRPTQSARLDRQRVRVRRLYRGWLRGAARRGLGPGPAQTPRTHQRLVAARWPPAGPPLTLLTGIYERARFSDRPLTPAEVAQARHGLRGALRALARLRRPREPEV